MAKVVINNDQEIRVVGVGNQQPIKVVKIGPVATIPGGGTVDSVVAGAGVSVNSTDPANPVVSNAGVITATAGSGISINATDPQNIVITNTGTGGSPGSPDTAVQFNSSGSFAGDANFTYNTGRLAVGTTDFTTQPHSRIRALSDSTGSGHSDATGIWSRAVNGVDSTAGGIFEAYGNDAWPGSIVGISAQATTTTNAGQSGIGANINIDADGVTSTADSYGILVGNNQPGNANGTVRGYAIKARSAGSGTRPRIGVWSAINTVATGSAAIRAEVETPGAGIYAGVFNGGNVGFKTSTPQATVDIEAADVRINGVTYQWPAADGSAGQFLQTDGAGNLTWATGSGGSGTVTSVSVTTANGVSGSVANPTTTPAITLTLGDITPTSVAASGTVTGSNLSGSNSGDQTIVLTGDVTGSGTGSFAATISNGAVTLAKIANAAANSKLLGSGATGAGSSYSEITLGTNLSMSGTTLNATSGGLSHLTEALSTTAPNATVNVESLTVTGATPNADLALVPSGVGGFALAVADNGAAGGNKRGAQTIDLQLLRSVPSQVASGASSVIAGGEQNTAAGAHSVVSGGQQNIANGVESVVPGGLGNNASGPRSFASGNACIASQAGTFAHGYSVQAIASFAVGFGENTIADKRGQLAMQSSNLGNAGDAQTSIMRVISNTTDATANVPLYLNGTAGGETMTLANNSAWTFSILIVAKDIASANSAHFKIEGGIVRGANAASTAIVGAITNTSLANAIGGTSAVTAVANTTTGALEVQVTGVAATTINWVASVTVSEVRT